MAVADANRGNSRRIYAGGARTRLNVAGNAAGVLLARPVSPAPRVLVPKQPSVVSQIHRNDSHSWVKREDFRGGRVALDWHALC